MSFKSHACRMWFAMLFFTVFAHPLAFAGENPEGIVVWRLQTKEGVTENDIDSISGVLAAEVERRSGRKVISEADIQTVVTGEETRQQCGAESTSCIAEIGAALGAPEAVAGDLGRIGSYWILNLRRINVRSVEVIGRTSRRIKGGEDALIESLSGAIAGLFGVETEEVPPAVVTTGKTAEKPGLGTLSKAGIGVMTTGAAMMIVGGVATWKTGEAKDNYEQTLKKSAKDDHSTWKSTSYAMYGLGAAALATGTVLLIVDMSRDRPDNPETARLDVGVAPTPNGVQAQLLLQW